MAVYRFMLEQMAQPAITPEELAQSAAAAAREAGEFTAAMMVASQPGACRMARDVALREGLEAAAAITATVNKLGAANG